MDLSSKHHHLGFCSVTSAGCHLSSWVASASVSIIRWWWLMVSHSSWLRIRSVRLQAFLSSTLCWHGLWRRSCCCCCGICRSKNEWWTYFCCRGTGNCLRWYFLQLFCFSCNDWFLLLRTDRCCSALATDSSLGLPPATNKPDNNLVDATFFDISLSL